MGIIEIEKYIKISQQEAEKAIVLGNAPFGAVAIDKNNCIITKAHNTVNSSCDPTAHAEINLLRKLARKLKKVKFDDIKIIINSEPCSMCASAIIRSGIREIYYGSNQETKQSLYIPFSDIAKKSAKKIVIKSGFLFDNCQKQILRGRRSLKNSR
jgi:tRNA(Arg) A34 adenosine deaminase TadA